MKKSLFLTTALVAAGTLALGAGDAAAKMKVGLSGAFKTKVGISKQNSSFESTTSSTSRAGYDSLDIKNDSEVHVKGSTKANGMTISINIQIESDVEDAGGIDESYMKVTGGFGDIRLGSVDVGTQTLKHGAPGGVGAIPVGAGDEPQWIIAPAAIAGAAKVGTNPGGGDNMRIVYISPKMNGFRVGGSYTPSTTTGKNMPATGGNAGTELQMYDGIVSFENKMGGMNLKADVGYWEKHGTAAASMSAWRTGINLGFGNVTVGTSYMKSKDMDSNGDTNTANANEVWDIGFSYKLNKTTSIGATHINAKSAQSAAVAGDDKSQRTQFGVGHSLGNGVSAGFTILHVKWDDETTADANNNDGWAGVGSLKVAF